MRVKKVAGGATTVYIFSGSKVIAEYDNGAAPASPSREYIYSGAALLAKIEGGASIYYHPDQLSTRVLTDSSGNILGQRGHYPFGDTWYESGTTTKLKFTSYERDSESTNDYAMARSYINRFGRFSSPDPLAGSLSNPQSLNRYAYVESDPINLADPSGAFLGPAIGSVPLYGPILNQNGGGAFGGATQDDINSEGQIFGDHARLAGDLVNDAFNKALKMLQSDKCNMFIGGNSVVSASQTLQELMSGNPDYGTVQVADLGQPLSYGTSLNAQTTGTPMSVQTNDLSIDGSTLTSEITTATITMNSASIGIARNPAVDLTTQNALTMLHELGHAINFIQGEGTSFVATDNMGTAQGLAQSQVNADLVAAMCLP